MKPRFERLGIRTPPHPRRPTSTSTPTPSLTTTFCCPAPLSYTTYSHRYPSARRIPPRSPQQVWDLSSSSPKSHPYVPLSPPPHPSHHLTIVFQVPEAIAVKRVEQEVPLPSTYHAHIGYSLVIVPLRRVNGSRARPVWPPIFDRPDDWWVSLQTSFSFPSVDPIIERFVDVQVRSSICPAFAA